MVGLMAWGLAVAVEGRWALAAALGGAAAAVKVPGGLVCLAVVLVSLPATAHLADRVRRAAQVAAIAVVTLLLSGVVTGLGLGWVHALGVPGVVRTPLSLTTQVGRVLLWAQDGLGVPGPSALELVRLGGMVLALGFACLVALRARTGDPEVAVRSVGLVLLAVVLLGPVVHHWYLLWAVPFLAAVRLAPRAEGALVAVVGLTGVVAPLDSSLQARGTDIVVAVLLVTGVDAASVVRQVVDHRRAAAVRVPTPQATPTRR
jgi:alpha-1,6-mannosyltransferase